MKEKIMKSCHYHDSCKGTAFISLAQDKENPADNGWPLYGASPVPGVALHFPCINLLKLLNNPKGQLVCRKA